MIQSEINGKKLVLSWNFCVFEYYFYWFRRHKWHIIYEQNFAISSTVPLRSTTVCRAHSPILRNFSSKERASRAGGKKQNSLLVQQAGRRAFDLTLSLSDLAPSSQDTTVRNEGSAHQFCGQAFIEQLCFIKTLIPQRKLT